MQGIRITDEVPRSLADAFVSMCVRNNLPTALHNFLKFLTTRLSVQAIPHSSRACSFISFSHTYSLY